MDKKINEFIANCNENDFEFLTEIDNVFLKDDENAFLDSVCDIDFEDVDELTNLYLTY